MASEGPEKSSTTAPGRAVSGLLEVINIFCG